MHVELIMKAQFGCGSWEPLSQGTSAGGIASVGAGQPPGTWVQQRAGDARQSDAESAADRPVGMLEQLQALQAEDPGTILIARRLHCFGFGSPKKLEDHFSQYGQVKLILVPHSRVKASPGRRARARPASIGFVVMATAKAAALARANGMVHTISGFEITVQAYERRDAIPSVDEEPDDLEDEASVPNSVYNKIPSPSMIPASVLFCNNEEDEQVDDVPQSNCFDAKNVWPPGLFRIGTLPSDLVSYERGLVLSV